MSTFTISEQRPGPGHEDRLLVFELDSLRFALHLRAVDEVLPSVLSRPLPDAPAGVEGLVSLRAEMLPVYNPRERFGLPTREPRVDEHLIVARTGERRVLMRVDRVVEIRDADAAGEVPDAAGDDISQLVCGVVEEEDGLLLIHDLDTFLTDGDKAQLRAALAAARTAQSRDLSGGVGVFDPEDQS